MKTFASDNTSGVHPQVLKAIVESNMSHCQSYGVDAWTEKFEKAVQKIFGANASAHLVMNGTAANTLGLAHLIRPYEAIIASDVSHLHLDECGAPEKFSGAKLFTVPSKQGKISVEDVRKILIRKGDQHYSQPRVISLTQPTELGTTYKTEELKAFRTLCDEHGLYLHIDGARLANAAVSLAQAENVEASLAYACKGADVLSLGGTKNGLLNVEAVVFLNKDLSKNFKFTRKMGLNLASKHRFLASQFTEYLEPGLWKQIAEHSHGLALSLAKQVSDIRGIELIAPVESNALFARVPKSLIHPLKQEFFFYVWDEFDNTVRWMITFDHTADDIEKFAGAVRRLM